MKINFLKLIFVLLTFLSCVKNDFNNFHYAINDKPCENDFYYKQHKVILKGVIRLNEKLKTYTFYIANEFQDPAGCFWEKMPTKLIEKEIERVNKTDEDLYVIIESEPKFINQKYRSRDEILEIEYLDDDCVLRKEQFETLVIPIYDSHATQTMKLENVKILKMYVGKKHAFKIFKEY